MYYLFVFIFQFIFLCTRNFPSTYGKCLVVVLWVERGLLVAGSIGSNPGENQINFLHKLYNFNIE